MFSPVLKEVAGLDGAVASTSTTIRELGWLGIQGLVVVGQVQLFLRYVEWQTHGSFGTRSANVGSYRNHMREPTLGAWHIKARWGRCARTQEAACTGLDLAGSQE